MRPLVLATALCLAGCSGTFEQSAVDAAMSSAYRPAPVVPLAPVAHAPRWPEGLELFAGDLHCHVLPPDHPSHVVRTFDETVALARDEGLDFVVLTPHVRARFFADKAERDRAVEEQRDLARRIAATRTETTFVAGMEYTDGNFGHVGLAFADLEQVLADVPLDDARRHPGRFFERWVARGGLAVVNHPFVTPVRSPVPIGRADLSWRPFTGRGPFPPEIQAVQALAHAFEVFNLPASHLRDRYLLGDGERSLSAAFARLDRDAARDQRRMTPVGGSDSHGHHLRATTFVLARDRTPAELRNGIAAGRVCVRGPEACSFEARASDREGPWRGPGASLGPASAVSVRASEGELEVVRDGDVVAHVAAGETATLAVPRGACSVVRGRVGRSFSGPIYVNCPRVGTAQPP